MIGNRRAAYLAVGALALGIGLYAAGVPLNSLLLIAAVVGMVAMHAGGHGGHGGHGGPRNGVGRNLEDADQHRERHSR